LLGLVTTPMYYYAQMYLNAKKEIMPGIMITASHNPKEYNGFKMSFNSFGNACGQMIQDFRVFVYEMANAYDEANLGQKGYIENVDIRQGYLDLVKVIHFHKSGQRSERRI
jgi:phosphomannomutase